MNRLKETIVGIIIVLLVICGAIWLSNKGKQGATEAEPVARDAEIQRQQAEERKWNEQLSLGVMATPPEWSKGIVLPEVDVDQLKEDLNLDDVLVRYRIPPDDPKECLEYLVSGVAKHDMSFVWKGEDGDDYIAMNTRDARHLWILGRFPESRRRACIVAPRIFRGLTKKGDRITLEARLTAEQLKGVRVVRFQSGGLASARVPGR